MKIGPESSEQILLFQWINLHPKIAPYAFHIAGERKCSPQYGSLLKKLGAKAGVADIFVAIPTKTFSGLWIELKAGKGRLTPNQKEFLDNMTSQGYLAVCCHGFEAAKEVIETYLKL